MLSLLSLGVGGFAEVDSVREGKSEFTRRDVLSEVVSLIMLFSFL